MPGLAHPRLQQSVQRGERIWQIPALQWRGLVERPHLPFQQRQEVHRVEDHVGLVVGPPVPGDHFRATPDDHRIDVAAHLDLMMGKRDGHGIIVVPVAHHRDRCGAGADFLAGIVGRGRQGHQGIQIAHQPLADRFRMPAHKIVLALQALLLQPGVQRIEALEPWRGDQEVAAAISNSALDMAFVITLGGPAELVVEQIVGLQLGEGPGPFALAVATDLGDREVVLS